MNPNYNEQFKIRLASSDKSMSKHDIIKTELVRAIKRTYKKKINHQIIYTEYQISKGVVCDVYHYNNLTKSAVAYEIQKVTSKNWLDKAVKKYNKLENTDLQIIRLNSLSDNIPELIEQVEALVC